MLNGGNEVEGYILRTYMRLNWTKSPNRMWILSMWFISAYLYFGRDSAGVGIGSLNDQENSLWYLLLTPR